jgi:hypothetical protein
MDNDNLFAGLYRYAHRQDENFVTASFALLLSHLCRHDWPAAEELLRRLCFQSRGDYPLAGPPAIRPQAREEDGQPDVRLVWPDAFVLVEVKKGSGLGPSQVRRYREILSKSRAPVRRLVLLTVLPVEAAGPTDDEGPHHVYWFEVGSWLRRLPAQDPVSRFLVGQFVAFLEEQRMAVRQITKDYVRGVELFRCLMTMLERAIRGVQPPLPIYRGLLSAGKGSWKYHVGDAHGRPYWVGVEMGDPGAVKFRFAEAPFERERTRWLPGWEPVRGKPALAYRLDDEFFALESEQQERKLTEFVGRAYQQAEQMRAAASGRP